MRQNRCSPMAHAAGTEHTPTRWTPLDKHCRWPVSFRFEATARGVSNPGGRFQQAMKQTPPGNAPGAVGKGDHVNPGGCIGSQLVRRQSPEPAFADRASWSTPAAQTLTRPVPEPQFHDTGTSPGMAYMAPSAAGYNFSLSPATKARTEPSSPALCRRGTNPATHMQDRSRFS